MRAKVLSNLWPFFEDFPTFIVTIEHMLAANDNNILVAFLNIERHAQAILREHCQPTENYNGTADLFRIGNSMIV